VLRYTKQRKAIEESVLQTYGVNLKPDKNLLENLCIALSDARKELAAVKAKSILRIVWERITK
jgi:hypothetical protein